jgi:hypothetical protein
MKTHNSNENYLPIVAIKSRLVLVKMQVQARITKRQNYIPFLEKIN